MNEQINSEKVREQVRKDGYDATKQAIDTATKKLTDRGFEPAQVRKLVKEGAERAVNEQQLLGAKKFRLWKRKKDRVQRLVSRPFSKADQKRKAKNDEFDVPFDMIVANGFGGGPGVRAAA